MRISVVDAKEQLSELIERAEAGEDVIVTDDGHGTVRLVPVPGVAGEDAQSPEERRRIMREIGQSGAAKSTPGPDAARSQDYLYDEHGLPA
jgi:prevent-host-death family protein